MLPKTLEVCCFDASARSRAETNEGISDNVMQTVKVSNAFQKKYIQGDAIPETRGNMSNPNGLTKLSSDLN